MRIGVVYSGEQVQPWLFRALYPIQLSVACVADSSVNPENRVRVKELASFFNCDFFEYPEEMFSTATPKLQGVVILSGETASRSCVQLIESALAAGIHVLSPVHLNALEDGLRLTAASEKYERLVMTGTRFIFGRCFQEILRIASESTFGTIQDMRFLLGIGRVANLKELLKFGDVHFQIVFEIVRRLFAEYTVLPEEVTVMASKIGARICLVSSGFRRGHSVLSARHLSDSGETTHTTKSKLQERLPTSGAIYTHGSFSLLRTLSEWAAGMRRYRLIYKAPLVNFANSV